MNALSETNYVLALTALFWAFDNLFAYVLQKSNLQEKKPLGISHELHDIYKQVVHILGNAATSTLGLGTCSYPGASCGDELYGAL